MFSRPSHRSVVLSLIIAAVLLAAPEALAVTSVGRVSESDLSSMTHEHAARARADVQVRRLKSMIVNRRDDAEAHFRQLEKLQKNLRGQSN